MLSSSNREVELTEDGDRVDEGRKEGVVREKEVRRRRREEKVGFGGVTSAI